MKISRIAALGSALILSLAVVGCGQGSNTSNKKITLTVWYWGQALDAKILDNVDKAFPNVHLVQENIGGNFESKLIASMFAGDAPDLTAINSADFIATMVKDHDQFVNLNQYSFVRQAEKNYLPWKWDLASTPDHKYQVAIPIDTGPVVLYYNSLLFKKAGLPTDPAKVSQMLKTWNDFMKVGEEFKAKTNVPWIDNLADIYEGALYQGTSYYFTPDMKPIYATNPTVKNAWNLAVEFHDKNLSADIPYGTNEWSAGTAHNGFATFIGASWKLHKLEYSDKRQGVWRIAAAPGGPSDQGGSFLGVTKDSKHPKLAAEVALWINDAANETKFYKSDHIYPSTIASFPNLNSPEPYFGGEIINKYFASADKGIKIGFQGPYDSTIDGNFTRQLSLIENDNKNPQQAWKDAVDQSKAQMKRILKN